MQKCYALENGLTVLYLVTACVDKVVLMCVVYAGNRVAYKEGKKEKPPFVKSESPEPVDDENKIPDELVCLICRDLMKDAVVIPCCGNCCCDECT